MKNELTAKRIKLALSNKNMKPQELADKSGINKASVSQYVNGSHKPSNISAGKMGEILDVEPLWLMGFDVPMERGKFKDTYGNTHISFDNVEDFKKAYDKSKYRGDRLISSIIENSERLNNDGKKSLLEYSNILLGNPKYCAESNHLAAAHERTDIEVTEEMRKYDDNIMMDDSEWE